MLAPTDAAFAIIPDEDLNALLANKAALNVVRTHTAYLSLSSAPERVLQLRGLLLWLCCYGRTLPFSGCGCF